MKIQRFNEASAVGATPSPRKFIYRGKGLQSNRKEFLDEFWSIFDGDEILGLEVSSCMFSPDDECIYLFLDTKEPDGSARVIKLDVSDMGIEIGKMMWNDDEEDYDPFTPESNLDSPQTKQMKNYKQDIGKFNV